MGRLCPRTTATRAGRTRSRQTGYMTDAEPIDPTPETPAPERLGEFRMARRARISPESAGLVVGDKPRRVPGLKREEVASLAAISPDYYMRLEQGRRSASPPVLEALARVLQLNDDERRYLFELSGKAPVQAPPARSRTVVLPLLQRVLDRLASPGFVLGRRMDVLAWNSTVSALITDFGAIEARRRNYALILFTDPAMRALHVDWPDMAQVCVAMLRMEAGQNPQDKRMAALIGELSMKDPDFRRWWADHHVAVRQGGTKRLRHPVVGDLTLQWDALTCAADPSQQLVVWTAEPGSPADEALRVLGSGQRAFDGVQEGEFHARAEVARGGQDGVRHPDTSARMSLTLGSNAITPAAAKHNDR